MMRAVLAVLALSLGVAAPVAQAHEHPTSKGHPSATDEKKAPPMAAHDEKAEQAGMMTVEGEVVDMACYMGHETKGEKHAKCAKQCVVGGSPAGILGADGSLYLLVEDHASPKPYDKAKRMAGEKAKVTGKSVKRGGIQALIVTEAVAAK